MTDAELRLSLYREFTRAGRAPSAGALATTLGVPIEELRAGFERLAAAHVIALQPESREIMFAAPLSAVPTPHVVHAAGLSYFAPCIWDALGALAMLHEDGSVESSCPCCGEALGVEVRTGEVSTMRGLVHFALPAKQWWDEIAFT